MRLRTVMAAALLGLTATATANAASLDVGLSNDAARFEYNRGFSGAGLDHATATFALTYDNDSDWLGTAGVEVFGGAAAPGSGLHAGAGVTAFAGHADAANKEMLGLGLGGRLRYVFPQANRFAVTGRVFAAPRITSFLDSEGYSDWSLQVEYELLHSARVFVGYREITADLKNAKNVSIDKSTYVGLNITF